MEMVFWARKLTQSNACATNNVKEARAGFNNKGILDFESPFVVFNRKHPKPAKILFRREE